MNLLAEKLRSNLVNKQNDLKEADDSLTNLNWLYDANPLCNNNEQLNVTENAKVSHAPLRIAVDDLETHGKHAYAGSLFDPLVRHEYRTKWTGKPPFSYATLICLAMQEMNKPKVTLSDIYGWIISSFAYYRHTDSSWQNSVRHNLSLNKCFEKVPREKGERGKGGFWRVNPKYGDWMEANIAKCRRVAPPPGPPPPLPRAMLLQLQSEQGRNINDPEFDPSELVARSLYMPVHLQQQHAHLSGTLQIVSSSNIYQAHNTTNSSSVSNSPYIDEFGNTEFYNSPIKQPPLHLPQIQNRNAPGTLLSRRKAYLAGYGTSNSPLSSSTMRRSCSSSSLTNHSDIDENDELNEDQDGLPINYSRHANSRNLNKRKRALSHIRVPFNPGPTQSMDATINHESQSSILYSRCFTKNMPCTNFPTVRPLRQSIRARRPAGTYYRMHEGVISSEDEDNKKETCPNSNESDDSTQMGTFRNRNISSNSSNFGLLNRRRMQSKKSEPLNQRRDFFDLNKDTRCQTSQVLSDELVDIFNDLPNFDNPGDSCILSEEIEGPFVGAALRTLTSTHSGILQGNDDDPIWPSMPLDSLPLTSLNHPPDYANTIEDEVLVELLSTSSSSAGGGLLPYINNNSSNSKFLPSYISTSSLSQRSPAQTNYNNTSTPASRISSGSSTCSQLSCSTSSTSSSVSINFSGAMNQMFRTLDSSRRVDTQSRVYQGGRLAPLSSNNSQSIVGKANFADTTDSFNISPVSSALSPSNGKFSRLFPTSWVAESCMNLSPNVPANNPRSANQDQMLSEPSSISAYGDSNPSNCAPMWTSEFLNEDVQLVPHSVSEFLFEQNEANFLVSPRYDDSCTMDSSSTQQTKTDAAIMEMLMQVDSENKKLVDFAPDMIASTLAQLEQNQISKIGCP